VHGLVEFTDGSVLAQTGSPSMATPIGFALYHPLRAATGLCPVESGGVIATEFPAGGPPTISGLAARLRRNHQGGLAGAVLNGANEVAVEAFLAGRIAFGQIVPLVRQVLNTRPLRPK